MNGMEPTFEPLRDLRAPLWLDAPARTCWKRHAPILVAAGVLTEADRDLFAAACERWSVYQRASEILRGPGMTQTSKGNGRVALPEVAIAATALKQYSDLMAQFGVGAAARSRVRVTGGAVPVAPESPAKRFFGT